MIKTGDRIALTGYTDQTESSGQHIAVLSKRLAHESLDPVPGVRFTHFTADSDANFQ